MAYPSPQWKQWVETLNQIGNAITALHGKRAIWRSYQEHGKAGMASDEDGPFHDWMIRNYADSVTIGIRRVIDDDRRVRSLVRLLRDIEKRSGEITMAAFQSLWADAPHLAVVAPSCFERITGTRSVLPSSVPRNDRVQLKLRLRQLENWTNTRIAHTASGNPTGDDLT